MNLEIDHSKVREVAGDLVRLVETSIHLQPTHDQAFKSEEAPQS
jgi:hypothetical protein